MHDRMLEEPWEMETVTFEPSVYDPVLCETRKLTQHEFDEVMKHSGILYSETVNGAPMRPIEPMRFCPECGRERAESTYTDHDRVFITWPEIHEDQRRRMRKLTLEWETPHAPTESE